MLEALSRLFVLCSVFCLVKRIPYLFGKCSLACFFFDGLGIFRYFTARKGQADE
jgi:hypothetical protein